MLLRSMEKIPKLPIIFRNVQRYLVNLSVDASVRPVFHHVALSSYRDLHFTCSLRSIFFAKIKLMENTFLLNQLGLFKKFSATSPHFSEFCHGQCIMWILRITSSVRYISKILFFSLLFPVNNRLVRDCPVYRPQQLDLAVVSNSLIFLKQRLT